MSARRYPRRPFQSLAVLLVWTAAPGATVMAAEHRVKSGESIQKAIDQAAAGDTILVEPGLYKEFLHIDKPDIRLTGILRQDQWPHLDGGGKLNDGVIASGSGFVIENFRISGYKGNGVTTQAANNVVMRHLIVENTGIYGIYPTLGKNILIEDTVTSGIEDAGIYVGQCENVDVRRNELYGNVAGIEIENSLHVLVENNLVYDNTGGILVFALPGLPKKQAADIIVRGNFIINNNHANFGAPGSVVANVPPGSGLVILSADDTVIEGNIIRDNQLAGIIIADGSVMPNTAPDPQLEPNPDRIAVMRNLYAGNGRKTAGFMLKWYRFIARNLWHGGSPEGTASDLVPPGADVYFAGKGTGNCLLDATAVVTVGTESFVPCRPEQSPAATKTFLTSAVQTADAAPSGEQVHAAVCSGCHTFGFRLIGPPIKEIQEKYRDNPDGIAAFAAAPVKVRDDFPEMPGQAYLGKEKLALVARYFLEMKE